eukprot:6207669-Pleurochrysis_carterae.AAC.2
MVWATVTTPFAPRTHAFPSRGVPCASGSLLSLRLDCRVVSLRSGTVDTETYVHRSGRTGRAGRKARSLSRSSRSVSVQLACLWSTVTMLSTSVP